MAKRSRSATERAAQAERLRSRPARGRILQAARELSMSRGYEQVRVGELAAAASVSRETFYTHFANKRACFAEAIDPRLGEIEARCRSAQEDGEGWAAAMMTTVESALSERYDFEHGPRGRVLSTLLEQVGERGFAGTRLVDVLKSASVSHPSFYRRFGGKEACFAVAYLSLLRRIEGQIEGVAGQGASERLVALAEILAAEPGTARVLIDEAGRLPIGAESDDHANPHSLAELIARLLHASEPATNGGVHEQLMAGAILETFRSSIRSGRAATLASQVPALLALFQPREPASPTAPDHSRRRRPPRRREARPAQPALA